MKNNAKTYVKHPVMPNQIQFRRLLDYAIGIRRKGYEVHFRTVMNKFNRQKERAHEMSPNGITEMDIRKEYVDEVIAKTEARIAEAELAARRCAGQYAGM